MRILLISLLTSTALTSISALGQEVDPTLPITISAANQMVADLLKNKISSKEYFCVKDELTCRAHYGLEDASGKKMDAFYVRFTSADRSVGSNGYFFPVKGQPGKFIRFEDFTFDGKINVDKIELQNIVTVEKDHAGKVCAILGSILPRLGTTKYMVADLTVNFRAATLEGTVYDSADPNFIEKSKIEYRRNRP